MEFITVDIEKGTVRSNTDDSISLNLFTAENLRDLQTAINNEWQSRRRREQERLTEMDAFPARAEQSEAST